MLYVVWPPSKCRGEGVVGLLPCCMFSGYGLKESASKAGKRGAQPAQAGQEHACCILHVTCTVAYKWLVITATNHSH